MNEQMIKEPRPGGVESRKPTETARTFTMTERIRAQNWDDAARQALDAWNAFISGQPLPDKTTMPDRLPALCSCYLWLKSVGIVKPGSPGLKALELRITDRIAGLLNISPKAAEIPAGAMMLRMVFVHARSTGTDLGAAIKRTMDATTDAEKSSMKWTGLAAYRLWRQQKKHED